MPADVEWSVIKEMAETRAVRPPESECCGRVQRFQHPDGEQCNCMKCGVAWVEWVSDEQLRAMDAATAPSRRA